ncbi:MAG: EI24 domain-containing protein [Bacteroidales bacterium]|nr:EI24 domain-containing protein [Bacteroidales bacterium]
MSIFEEFIKALSLQGRAFRFICKNGLAWTFLMPVVVFIVFGVAGFWSVGEIVRNVSEMYGTDYSPLLFSIGLVMLKILFFIVFGVWGGYIVVILMSPFMAYVSEKTEQILNGNEYPFDLIQFIKDTLRGIFMAIRNFFVEIILSLLVFVCAFMPIVGSAIVVIGAPVILFFVSSYFYGFSFMDYTNERRKLSVRQSVRVVRSRKGTACGHGFMFVLLLYVPFVGSFLSALFAVISTVAATIDMVEVN